MSYFAFFTLLNFVPENNYKNLKSKKCFFLQKKEKTKQLFRKMKLKNIQNK